MPRSSTPIAPVLAAVVMAASLAAPEVGAREAVLDPGDSIHLQAEVFVALFNDAAEYSNIAGGFGWAGRAGWRRETRRDGAVGVFGQIERDRWLSSEIELDVVPGVFNLGVGVEYLSFGGRVRSSLAAGTSTLMFDTAFHDKGRTGYFVDLRPACLRWAPLGWLTVELCVIGFTLLSPVVDEASIRKIEYRTTLTLEVPL